MENWQKQLINNKIPELVRITNVNVHLLAKLQAENVLSQMDVWDLESTNHPGEKARKLYQLVQTRAGGTFEKLIEALKNCGQTGAAALLEGAEAKSVSNEKFEKSEEIPMKNWRKEHIRKNLDMLVNSTNINAMLLSYLMGHTILTNWDIQELNSINGHAEKTFRFYALIQTKTDSAYEQLIDALKSGGQTRATRILQDGQEPIEQPTQNADLSNKTANGSEDKMLDWQCKHIGANLNALIECTFLSAPVLSNLVSKQLLDVDNLCELASEPDTTTKLLKFYEIVQFKGNNAYEKLIEVMEQHGMSGAKKILQEAQ